MDYEPPSDDDEDVEEEEAPVLARLVLYSPTADVAKTIALRQGENQVGSAEGPWDADASYGRIADATVSRRHATIEPRPDTKNAFVRDVGSSNGTSVRLAPEFPPVRYNRKKSSTLILPNDGIITFGDVSYLL